MIDTQRTGVVKIFSVLTYSADRGEGVFRRHFVMGENLFCQNEPASNLFYIISGYVRIYILSEDGRERTPLILGPSDMVGEDAFYLCEDYTSYAEAFEGSVDVFQISRSGYESLVERWPELYKELLASLASINRKLTHTIEVQTFQDLRGRVQMVLIATAGRYGRVVADGVEIELNLTHETIASLVGATRARVSVCLSELQHEGFYHVVNQHIVLSSWAAGLVLPP